MWLRADVAGARKGPWAIAHIQPILLKSCVFSLRSSIRASCSFGHFKGAHSQSYPYIHYVAAPHVAPPLKTACYLIPSKVKPNMLANCPPPRNSSHTAEAVIDPKAFLKAMWNNKMYGMYVVEVIEGGADFRFLAFNDALAVISPIPIEQLQGKRLQEALPTEIATSYHRRYSTCVRTGHIVEFEEHITDSEDNSYWWNLSIDPIKNRAGEIYQLVVTVADVTAKRAAEAALDSSREVLQKVMDTVPSAIFWKDRQSRYLGCNRAFLRATGLATPTEIIGKSDYELVWKDQADWFYEYDQRIMNADEPELNIIEPQIQAGGRQAWLRTSKIPLHDTQGQVTGLLGLIEDITDRKAAEDEQARLLAILEATPDIVSMTDINGYHRYLNRAGQLTFNIKAEKVRDFHLSHLMHPDEVAKLTQEALPVAKEKGSWHGESVVRDCHQRNIPVSLVIIHHSAEAGAEEYFSSIMRDISERKAAEATFRDNAERQAVLNEISNQVRNSLDLDTVIATTLMSVHQGLKLDYCGFAWIETDSEDLSWKVIQAVDDTDCGIRLGEHDQDRLGIDIWQIVQQNICRVDDAQLCTQPEHRAFLQRQGICSEILVPAFTDINRVGVIVCYDVHQPRAWSAEDVELLRAVAGQLAIAINQANLYTESCRQSQELTYTLEQLKRTQAQIIQAEKMSSLGQMVAGVAHEINNPVNFIHGNLEPAQDYAQDLLGLIEKYQLAYPSPSQNILEEIEDIDLDFVKQDLPKLLKSMTLGTERIREIVLSLRNFSRLDEAAVKTVDLHEGIDSTLVILNHKLKSSNASGKIDVIKNYGQLPKVDCYPSQLNQVLMNILSNAIDALEKASQPTITLSTAIDAERQQAIIRIADNGSGIPEDIQPQILDPFFTTKPVGKGTGMGMSISYQIVTEKHGGELSFTSKAGEGTEFTIAIPLRQPEATI